MKEWLVLRVVLKVWWLVLADLLISLLRIRSLMSLECERVVMEMVDLVLLFLEELCICFLECLLDLDLGNLILR
jgi:hypothetical protein